VDIRDRRNNGAAAEGGGGAITPARPPGKKPKNEWLEDVKAAVALKIRDDPKILRKPNYDALNREIRADFDKAKRWLPNDRKETEKIIHEFIQRLRDLNPP
jgi:hypothetical protein